MADNVILKPIPELTETLPGDRLAEFFRRLGWDGNRVVNPVLVKLHQEDWQEVLRNERKHAETVLAGQMSPREVAVDVGLLWMNWGPSAGGQHRGMVELHPGWLEQCREERAS